MDNEISTVFSTAYLPPIEYLLVFLQSDNPYIEANEHFIKQSYRNRCLIPTANGVLNLSIPVAKNGLHHCPIQAVQLDYSQPWQRTHWRALETAYNTSPFFLYYRDYIEPFFVQQQIQTLWEFNQKLFDTVLKLLGITKSYAYTTCYKASYDDSVLDLRQEIHPKKRTEKKYPYRELIPYRQVFFNRFGFIPNMSCLDLLFNEGKWAKTYLMNEMAKQQTRCCE